MRCHRLGDACMWPAVASRPRASPTGASSSKASTPETRRPSAADDLMSALSSLYHGSEGAGHRGAGPAGWQVAEVAAQSAGQVTTSATPSATTPTPPALPFEFDLMDLRLLHHYTMHVHATLDPTAAPVQQRIWQDTVLRLGFDHPFLLRGILALSALHLLLEARGAPGTDRRGDKRDLTALKLRAASHVDAALTMFRQRLGQDGQLQLQPAVPGGTGATGPVDGDDDAPSAVFVFACLLVVHSFAHAKLLGTVKMPLRADNDRDDDPDNPDDPDDPDDPISALVASFRLIRGVNTLLQPHFLRILASEVAPLIANAMPSSSSSSGLTGSVHQDVPALVQLHQWISRPADGDADDIDTSSDAHADAHAVDELHRIATTVDVHARAGHRGQASLLALMLVWPAAVSDVFIDHVARRRPRSLIVLAHFATLFQTGALATCWWITGWGRAVVEAVEAEVGRAGQGQGNVHGHVHDESSSSLLSWLAWPKAEIFRETSGRHRIERPHVAQAVAGAKLPPVGVEPIVHIAEHLHDDPGDGREGRPAAVLKVDVEAGKEENDAGGGADAGNGVLGELGAFGREVLEALGAVLAEAHERRDFLGQVLGEDAAKGVDDGPQRVAVVDFFAGRDGLDIGRVLFEAVVELVVLRDVGGHDPRLAGHLLDDGEELGLLFVVVDVHHRGPDRGVVGKRLDFLGLDVRRLQVDGVDAADEAVVDGRHLDCRVVKDVILCC
ncbi:hypothetical protein SPBR_03914 [Sporothrix brasiliensis 5110]|uniref:C6 zinc finger domain containing protein n=1 Tax=Sporothrix brasiliensis 5110 TaxID=1398154 RepID=A0A0C2JEB3_9PEZI|nr:uncharacterized protein SPBR_03914 [Sporothrix brasiliensis 5110]KIH95297.1 hypothetical protein SPBR_03914 [Sporothrix brasiliensis 5110]